MEYFTLANGLRIPAVGSGTNTFAKTERVYNGSTKEVCSAIEAGYRFFDTAEAYGNEEAVGNGVIESGVGRKNILLCTKMSSRNERPMGREDAAAAIERSLSKLKTDYIDLYLLHFPRKDPAETAEIWKGFEEAYRKGILKAIGVCNFQPRQLEELLAVCDIPPMVDQVRCNPDDWNNAAVSCAQKNGIYPMAWAPLTFDAKHRTVLETIGTRYSKTWAQTMMRYQYQRGVITIPKSHSFEHQKANLDIFDFALTDSEMAEISVL